MLGDALNKVFPGGRRPLLHLKKNIEIKSMYIHPELCSRAHNSFFYVLVVVFGFFCFLCFVVLFLEVFFGGGVFGIIIYFLFVFKGL